MNAFTQKPGELEKFLNFLEEDIENVKRVLEEVEEEEIDAEFIIHAKAETVQESAENTEIPEKEIVKTLVFTGEEPVAVLCPGNTSVSEEKLEKVLDSEVRMADPEEVEEATGYTIGGVSPFDLEIKTVMEEEILKNEKVKPAAGSRVVGVQVNPEELKETLDAEVADVSR